MAEERAPEHLFQRHRHVAAGGEFSEDFARLGLIAPGERQRNVRFFLLMGGWAPVGGHDLETVALQGRVHDFAVPLLRHICGGRRIADVLSI